MGIVKIKDKTFKTSIPEAEILKKVQVVADRINKDFEGKKPVFLAVLNGSFIFAADLMRMITIPSEISFVKYASYEGTSSTGSMKTLMGINQDLAGRHDIRGYMIFLYHFTRIQNHPDLLRPRYHPHRYIQRYPHLHQPIPAGSETYPYHDELTYLLQ